MSTALASSSPTSRLPNAPRRNTTTDKSALLSALAQELRFEQSKAEQAAKEMIHLEHLVSLQIGALLVLLFNVHSCYPQADRNLMKYLVSLDVLQIEEKHSSFLVEQDRLIFKRDRNNSQIANLRIRLATLQRELDTMQNVREEEAESYLDLIEGGQAGHSVAFLQNQPNSVPREPGHVVTIEGPHELPRLRSYNAWTQNETARFPAPLTPTSPDTTTLIAPLQLLHAAVHAQPVCPEERYDTDYMRQQCQEDGKNTSRKQRFTGLLRRTSPAV